VVSAPQPRQSFRPSASGIKRFVFARGAAVWLLLTVIQLVASAHEGRQTFATSLIVLISIAVAGIAFCLWYSVWVRIELDDVELRIRRFFGRKLYLLRMDVGGVALRDVLGPGARARPVFLIYDKSDRCRATFDRRLWTPSDIEKLSASLGGRGPKPRRTTDGKLEDEFPGSVSWWRQHGVLVAVGIVLIPIAAVVVLHTA
jgi:hypothetical protein